MIRTAVVIISMVFLNLLISPLPMEASCTKTELQAAVDQYISAQKTGNTATLSLAENARYSENLKSFPVEAGVLSQALPIAFHRDFLIHKNAVHSVKS